MSHTPSRATTRLRRTSTAAGLALVVAIAGTGNAVAAAFQSVAQQRSVRIAGNLHEQDYVSGAEQVVNPPATSQSTLAGDFGAADLGAGLSIQTTSSSAFGQGRAGQLSTLGPDAIRFSGIADINISGYAASPVHVEGWGSASVNANYQFIVAKETAVQITMDSSGNLGDFNFSLTRDGNPAVLQDAYLVDASGFHTSFTRSLILGAGSYSLISSLIANSHLDGDISVAGRTTADFSITAVPEPGTWAMLLAGLAMLGMATRRKTR